MDELILGVTETPGEKHNWRILEYHQKTSLKATTDEIPWCSSFVNWVLAQCWIKGTNNAMARSFTSWGDSTTRQVGAITVLWRGSPTSPSGHVVFLVGGNDLEIFLLGGNQGNRVSVQNYPIGRVLGYRWPKEQL